MSKSWLHKGAEFKTDLLAGGLIFGVTLFIFWLSPMRQVTDSRYSMMASQCLLEYGSFALDHYAIPRLDPIYDGVYVSNGGFARFFRRWRSLQSRNPINTHGMVGAP